MRGIRTKVFDGGEIMDNNGTVLKNVEECSDIVIGLPGKIKALSISGFSTSEMLHDDVTRKFVHSLRKEIPRSAQVMSLSSTLDSRSCKWCKGLVVKTQEVFIDDEARPALQGIFHHYVKLTEAEKAPILGDIMCSLEFYQVCIFVKSSLRA
ncbi:Suppressor of the cold-sensitive snRNP biogenesis mutant brr1-1 [Podila verticillata]|nr:Suppressor of the cold-sensitive snRNP biogenesis mutant brr1-1 [Podila verticillata]